MKREYFGALFIIVFTLFYLALAHFFGFETVSKYIIIWVLIAYFVGQYSVKFPKNLTNPLA